MAVKSLARFVPSYWRAFVPFAFIETASAVLLILLMLTLAVTFPLHFLWISHGQPNPHIRSNGETNMTSDSGENYMIFISWPRINQPTWPWRTAPVSSSFPHLRQFSFLHHLHMHQSRPPQPPSDGLCCRFTKTRKLQDICSCNDGNMWYLT